MDKDELEKELVALDRHSPDGWWWLTTEDLITLLEKRGAIAWHKGFNEAKYLYLADGLDEGSEPHPPSRRCMCSACKPSFT